MGAQLSLSAQTSPSIAIFSYIDVLDEVHYVSQLNSSRFLKTCKGLDPNGEIIIKVFIKPNEDYNLNEIQKMLYAEALLLAPLPTALNFSKVIESHRAGYLIRQHLKSNLYDRLSSRPYLSDIETKFMTFQLLQALNDIHNLDITHGDIKTENILVTSSNWLVLTDFSTTIKPAYLPDDNPGEFSFYFDTSKRRTCYLAPERFNSELHHKTKGATGQVTKEMDIFSMGCCIAEIFAEGRALFNLSQLFKYKTNEYDVNTWLAEEIKSAPLQELIKDMIQLDPKKRLPCQKLLDKYRTSFFPEYFYTFTYEYFRTLATMGTSVPSIGAICGHSTLEDEVQIVDECCAKVYEDFGKICEALGYPLSKKQRYNSEQFFSSSVKLSDFGILELQKVDMSCQPVKEECALLFISYVSHGLRNIVSSTTKLRCVEMLVAFSQFISDENKLDRVVPFLVACFEDEYPNVQALAIQALAQVLHVVEKLNPINETVFIDYLLPRLKRLLQQSKQNTYVRMVLANCLGDLVTVANRFQELSYFTNPFNPLEAATQGLESLEIASKHAKKLGQQVEELVVVLLTDNETRVKAALLSNILPLCKFFGRERTNDVVLSHLITYLNDKDPSLRIKLIQTISGIAVLLGPITLEQYILPLLVQTITDSEELVVVNVLQSLKDLCKTGLMQKRFFYDICTTTASLLLHPNVWIRQFSLLLIVEISDKLAKAEVYCVLYPIVRPFFEFDVEFTYDLMLSSCKQPVSRTVYSLLCSWSLRASKSLFWQQVPNNHVDAFGNSNATFITKDYSKKNYGFNVMKASKAVVRSFDNKEIPLTTEDKNWIDKFKTVGLAEGDLWKIAVLRNYVLRTAKLISRRNDIIDIGEKGNIQERGQTNISLSHVMPRNVFFDIEFTDSPDTNQISFLENTKREDEEDRSVPLSQLPSVKDLNGSLMFNTKAAATTTSNLENIYVQLKFTSHHKETTDDLMERGKAEPKFIVQNSYEGDVSTIKTFLHQIKLLPSMREYKEFGSVISNMAPKNSPENIKGRLVTNLTENEPNSIIALAVSDGPVSYLISGSVQGLLKLWDIIEVTSGEVYSSSLSHDCSSSITDIAMLNGYDAFCVSTKDGLISILRVLHQGKERQRKFTGFQSVRRLNINQNSDKETYVTCIKTIITEEKSLLYALTNTSDIMVIDIRTMKYIHRIESLPTHGAVSSFVIGEEGSVLIVGTTKGIIDIWDLRFNILIKSWTFGDHTAITHLEEFDAMGSNTIAVVGGFSGAMLTIWNYSKMRCQQAVINTDEQPSIENFLPSEKIPDQLVFQDAIVSQNIVSLYTKGNVIIMSNGVTNDVFMINVKNLASSSVIIGPGRSNSSLVPVQVTTNLTFLLLKKIPDSSETNPVTYCNDTINCITSASVDDFHLLLTADNSGVINVIC